MWVMLSSIVDLPHKVRESKENILIHSLYIGESLNFNEWFDNVNRNYGNLFDGSISICGYKIKLFCSIFDLPARAKALNMTTFNGYFACTNCLTKGFYNTKVIYKYTSQLYMRDKQSYKECLSAIEDSRGRKSGSKLGIKGPTCLSASINILEDVLYDYMHLCCEGYICRFLNLIVNSSNHRESFYIRMNIFPHLTPS
jgi:hypothetical protein